jgi:predicted dehydrogenase
MSNAITRRDFMTGGAIAAAGAAIVAPAVIGSRAGRVPARVSASDRLRVGLIGSGRQGMYLLERLAAEPSVEIAAICDVYKPNLDQAIAASGGKPQRVSDFRHVLDQKDIDAVVVSPPDHWHALITVEACKAGKDVYVEKPISLTIEEGQKIVAAARKYNRVVQAGTMQRSGAHFAKAVQLVQNGTLGKVNFVRTWNYSNDSPKGIGNPPDSDAPAGLDWNMWLGPAPLVPFNPNRFGVAPDRWSTFRYFWDYAGGMMTDWGVHLLDVVQWAMKVDGPITAGAMGGKWCLEDNRETPDTLQVTYEYPGFLATYESRFANGNSMYGKNYGIEFHGTQATMFLDRGGFAVYQEKPKDEGHESLLTPSLEAEASGDLTTDHIRNFLACVESRQRPASDIETAHRSTSTCLLGNIAYRSKQRLSWDASRERLVEGGPEASKLLSRAYRAPWKLEV